MKRSFPTAEYLFKYQNTPLSGNDINGLGITEKIRPVQIFHGSGARKLEWQTLELFFLLSMPFRVFFQGLKSRWLLRRADGSIAKKRVEISEPARITEQIKHQAKKLGAETVGVCHLPEDAQYQNCDKHYKYAISIAYPMDYEIMDKYVTQEEGGLETLRTYTEITNIAIKLAEYIRSQGWPARAYCESGDLLQIPIAVAAGVGQMGKHGSLITKESGSNIRLATVLTDIPMATDHEVDIGVEDLCASCRRCTTDCPADAISDAKQLVRGIEKWYVDFDKCVPYFSKTLGCGICIQVCPWSKPGRGPSLSEKLLSKKPT